MKNVIQDLLKTFNEWRGICKLDKEIKPQSQIMELVDPGTKL